MERPARSADHLMDLGQFAVLAFRLLVGLLALLFLVRGRLLGVDHVCEDVLDLLGTDLLRGQDRSASGTNDWPYRTVRWPHSLEMQKPGIRGREARSDGALGQMTAQP